MDHGLGAIGYMKYLTMYAQRWYKLYIMTIQNQVIKVLMVLNAKHTGALLQPDSHSPEVIP